MAAKRTEIAIPATVLEAVLRELKSRHNLDLSGFEGSLLEARLCRRMRQLGQHDPKRYLAQLRADPGEGAGLVELLSVNVSRFFRNPPVFDYLETVALPERLERRLQSGSPQLRLWSAGCGSGEEPYSLAIGLEQVLASRPEPASVHLFATDIDRRALAAARAGHYPRASLVDARLGIVDRWFRAEGDAFVVLDQIRDRVRFSADDLCHDQRVAPVDAVYGDFDLICCRNVLIYLRAEQQSRVLHKLIRALAPGGFLVLGQSEIPVAVLNSGLRPAAAGLRVYQRAEETPASEARARDAAGRAVP